MNIRILIFMITITHLVGVDRVVANVVGYINSDPRTVFGKILFHYNENNMCNIWR